jgi:hypothetical protein
MNVGDRVLKKKGYKYPGTIVAKFKKLDDETVRFVVESTSPGTEGMLHIFSEDNLVIWQGIKTKPQNL